MSRRRVMAGRLSKALQALELISFPFAYGEMQILADTLLLHSEVKALIALAFEAAIFSSTHGFPQLPKKD
jgi:hypothetical protein